MNIRIVTNGYENAYGILQDDFLTVPITHKTPLEAIEEWEYFQKLNTERRFLKYVMSLEEVEEVVNKLKSEL